jgi:PAS domain S-box-containing protein
MKDIESLLGTLDRHAIVSITDVAGRIVYVNPRFCEVSGYRADELLGQNHRILKSDQHPDAFFRDLWSTISGGKVWHGEIKNRKKHGGHYWVESTIAPVFDAKGVIERYVSIRTEITALKEVQDALRASEERFRSAMEDAPIGMALVGLDGRWLIANRALCDMLGYDEDELVARTCLDVTHPDDVASTRAGLQEMLQGGKRALHADKRYLNKAGQTVWAHLSVSLVRGYDGAPAHFITQIQDISARVSAERALADSEALFRQLAENIREVFFVRDVRGNKLVYVSPVYQELWWRPVADLYRDPMDFLNGMHPEDRDRMRDFYLRQDPAQAYEVEYRLARATGGDRWIRERAYPVRDENGIVTRVVGFAEDITRRKRMENELHAAMREADAANRAKSEFLGRMSHELRTPLNAILGFAQMLKTDVARLPEDQRDGVDYILKAGWHLLDLIGDVLDLARIEQSKLEIKPEDIVLIEIVQESLLMVEPLAQQRGVRVAIDAFHDGVTVRADRVRLRQVLVNLLSNAVKYNRRDGEVHVTCSAAADRERVRVGVSDSGEGMSPEQLERLFEPFNRLGRENSDVEGSGIGLVVTRRLVELMGGTLGVESSLGVGTTFWIELPVTRASPARAASPEDEAASSVAAADGAGDEYTLLYVEDNPVNLRLIERILARRKDVRLISAANGMDGLALAQAQRPDVILLDIHLPDMDGFEVLCRLREGNLTAATPVIALSADALPKDIERALASGFDAYITKPILLAEFERVLQDALQRSRARAG